MTDSKPLNISAIILAGGRASRMGGIDKGLTPINGRPMVSYVIDRIQPQVDELFINANRELAAYEQFNLPTLSDEHAGFIGPLAGFQLGLKHAKHDLVLTVPCDAPLVDTNLASKLFQALTAQDADIAVAKSDGDTHPVFCLCKKSALTLLIEYIEQGGRKVSTWQKSLNYIEVDLSAPNANGVTESFMNVNTSDELALATSKLAPNNAQIQQSLSSPDALSSLLRNQDCQSDYDPNSMSVASAKHYIQQFLDPIQATEILPLSECLGRVLANDINATENVPNYDNSAMDGYAFHSSALNLSPIELKIKTTILAGDINKMSIQPNECARIMTGGMLPEGADTVVMQERTSVNDNVMQVLDTPKPQANVRYAGEDLKKGQTVLSRGHRLKPADIGLIASLGISELSVYKPLHVAVFSTGDELVQLGSPLKTGQVYDSNRYTLISMLKQLGVQVIDKGAVPDDPQQLETVLLSAANEAEVVITSGGVSVGQADYMKDILAKHGQILFWKLAMKPGRPLAYGKLNTAHASAHYFGLPGNPVAVMVTFYQFVREALFRVMGQTHIPPVPTFSAKCTSNLKKMAGRMEFQRGLLFQSEEGEWQVKSSGSQSSAMLSSMSAANCFIVLDEATQHVPEGSLVNVQLFEGIT